MHICVGNLTFIGADNRLSPDRRQAIIWTNDDLLLIEPLGRNFSKNWFTIQTFSLRKMHLKVSSAQWRPFCLSINVLTHRGCKGIVNISQTILSNCPEEELCGLIRIHWGLFLERGPINMEVALVWLMVWYLPGNKPIPEPIMIQLTGACKWHQTLTR